MKKKTKKEVFEEILEIIDNVKKVSSYTSDIFDIDSFREQNDKVFNLNVYVLIRLYQDEYNEFMKTRDKFDLNAYYDFVDSIGLSDKMTEVYAKMPKTLARDEIVPYVTDVPSFMSMIK